MAAVEQHPTVQQRIPRSRSARLADQAATAALYVTHPERRLSLREPRATGEPDLQTLKATGSRPGFSHASALAALSQSKQRETGDKQTVPATTFYTPNRRPTESPSHEVYQAAICAVRDRRSVSNLPPVSASLKYDYSTGRSLESRQGISQRDKARSAATGAYWNRRRADSAPSQAPYASGGAEAFSEPLGDLDSSMEASRIQNAANANVRIYTASPPMSAEAQEYRRKSILQAAAVSMAREMYGIIESKEGEGTSGATIPAAQKGHTRVRSQRSLSKPDAAILQQAVSLQDIAQKRAAEKLASMENETHVYREYYGVDQQPTRQITRTTFSMRRRRGSNETDASGFDVERSREIRTQMSTLRSRLNAVDEQREKDRATLLEAAKKNVDAVLHDMEMRVTAETGRAPPAMQKELEEQAMARAMQGKSDMNTEYPIANKVNIGGQTYMDMADVEAVARSRLQPTFDEITSRAETQRAKELEERLDAEERQRQKEKERQREAEIKAEEKRHKALLKQEAKSKEDKSEKTWLWRRKSKRAQPQDLAVAEDTTTGAPEEAEVNRVAEEESPETERQETTEPQTTDVTGALAEEPQMEPATRQESRIKSWFKDRLRRRSSVAAAENGEDEGHAEVEDREANETNVAGATQGTEETDRANAGPTEEARVDEITHEDHKSEVPDVATIAKPADGVAYAPGGDSRNAPLRSHPVTAHDLGGELGGVSLDTTSGGDKLDGMSTGEYMTTQKDSKEKVEHNSDLKRNRLKEGLKRIVSRSSGDAKSNTGGGGLTAISGNEQIPEASTTETEQATATNVTSEPLQPTSTASPDEMITDREALRESATDQGLVAPPVVGKQLSNGTGRESRFSEDL